MGQEVRKKNMYKILTENNKARYIDDVEKVEIEIPGDFCMGMAEIDGMKSVEENEYLDSILHPIKGKRLKDIVLEQNAKSACILVSDATRNVPTQKVAGILVQELCDGGIPLSQILFIVAIGVHRDATEEEMCEILGEDLFCKVKIENHTPFSDDNLITLGTTSFGTPVEVNKRACGYDLHISVGKVEPHEFAGFSGGRKSVLPGISSERTIEYNHSTKMLYSEKAVPGCLEGNPIHMDMVETAELFRIDFTVSFVLNAHNQTATVFSGPMKESHQAAVDYLRQYCRSCFEKPDIIVTTPGSPLNIDFYQSLKPLIALTDVLDSAITVALYCECKEGVNSPDMIRPFYNTSSLEEMINYVIENYKIQMDHALLLSKIFKKNVNIVVYSPNVSDEDINNMRMIPSGSIEDMMSKAMDICEKQKPKILFYPQAQKSLPELM